MSYLHQMLSEENTKFYVEVTAQDATRASQVYNDEPQFELYIDKDSPFRYVSNDLNMMITFLQRLGDRQIEITDSNVGEHMDDMEADFELEEKKGRDMDGDNDIDSDDYLLAKDQAIKNAMKGKKIKKSALKELVRKALQEQPMGMGQAKTGAVVLPKATNPADIKKMTDKGINVQLTEDDWMDPNDESDMAKSQLYKIGKYAAGLMNMIKDGEQLDAWVQAKLTKAADYLGAVKHYLEGEKALGMNEGDIKVGDMIGNTVQGFDHKVLAIQGDHYIVQDTVTGKKMKTFRDNMYKARTMKEGLGNDIMTLQAWLIKLNQTLAYEKREGGGKDLKQIAFLEKEIADAKAKLKEKLAQQKQGMNEAPSGQYYIKVNPRDYKKAVMLVNTSYPKANIEFNDPDTFYTPDIQTAEDLIMDFGTQDIEIVEDNLNDFGEYDSFDFEDDIEIYDLNPGLYENKSTCCMKCGHMHVKGTKCPDPTYSKDSPKHCKNRKK